MKKLIPSKTPEKAIKMVMPEFQPGYLRRYADLEAEKFMAKMPQTLPFDPTNETEIVNRASGIHREMVALSDHIKNLYRSFLYKYFPQGVSTDPEMYTPHHDMFDRFIIAVEEPETAQLGVSEEVLIKAGSEIVVARWAKGHSSPVHGHASGYLYEELLWGKMLVNTYQKIHGTKNIVRPLETKIIEPSVFLSKYNKPNGFPHPRPNYVHNFKALEDSITLHFLTEHTRDGRDNGFVVEYFEDYNPLYNSSVKQITAKDGMYLQIGEVVLVRSTNVPEYGDHYIVVTGPPVIKEHGFRVQDIAISAPHASYLLDRFTPTNGVTLLKLGDVDRRMFLAFHNIVIKDNVVILPNP